ncbi:MAG: type II toxin-antitoxin system Phd/YefM family antitoxin [Proteobacteria bacterium]|nr:type II toxin-antitoxin system Phd/YefM family antitoxin [Pseudomonadota bacterium]
MNRINIHEAKTHLSKYLSRLKKGETLILCKRNVPIAEIRPIKSEESAKRQIGLVKDLFSVPEAFFEPLPDEIVEAFSGDA